jgi:c-di-GMP-binding flagellar brake protein YcgR
MDDQLKKALNCFFPGTTYSDEKIAGDLADGTLVFGNDEAILPFLQTALIDEQILEVELDGVPTVYFSRLKDELPEPIVEEIDGETIITEPLYEEGEYLVEMDRLITLPLEPGMGNLYLRQSQSIVLRMFTSKYGVEFGTTFADAVKVRQIPVLRLAYPTIMRKVHNLRQFRAKPPEHLDFIGSIELDEDTLLNSAAVNISFNGIGLAVHKAEQKLLQLGSRYRLKLYMEDELLVVLEAIVRHLGKVRKRTAIEYLCGLEFNLESKTNASAIESIVARVQREHLKELARKAEAGGFDFIA